HFLPLQRIDTNSVLVALSRRHVGVLGGAEIDLNLVDQRHVAAGAVVPDFRRQIGAVGTFLRRVAFQARLLTARGCPVLLAMRVVAGYAGQRLTFLVTLALAEAFVLIGNVIVFRVAAFQGLEVSIQRFAGFIGEWFG